MKTPEEKRWERMQQYLYAESLGKTPVRISSTRTLFGIKSHAEEVLERTAADLEREQVGRARQKATNGKSANEFGLSQSRPEKENPDAI